MPHGSDQHTIDAAALLAQHAMTTRLMGVDFIPVSPCAPLAATPTAAAESSVEIKPDAGVSSAAVDVIRACHEGVSGKAEKLAALRERYEHDAPHDRFVTDHTSIVFGEGDPDADLMFVGEAPGQEEDKSGRPFVGRAGQLLEKMIVAMGYSRGSVYICNVLKTRPPNNATPTHDEAQASAPYLLEQIRIVDPKVIVTLGRPASCLLLGTDEPMRALRGRFHDFPGAGDAVSPSLLSGAGLAPRVVMPTYHPAFLLRSYTEENRRKVWSDLQQVVARLKDA